MHETVRPETLALDALIQQTLTRLEQSDQPGSSSADSLLFLGNRHQAFPTAVIKDPVLAPVDKLVWMVIMLQVQETAGNTAFPGYAAIAEMANIASRSTIARAIAILRATRWLTHCGRLRDASGRFRGNVYALHDEPMPLADAIHLDKDYMAFLNQAISHGHTRVRAVAQGVLDSLDEDIQNGRDVCAWEHPIERRIESHIEFDGGRPRRFFAFTQKVIRKIRKEISASQKVSDHHDQNSNMAEKHRVRNSTGQKSNSVGSSSYIYKTTTTEDGVSKFDITGEAGKPLIFPKRLDDNQRDIAKRYLRPLRPEQRQQVLDELEGRFQAEQKGMRPVYDIISFLAKLCKLAQADQFQPNLGGKVRESRRVRSAERQRRIKQKSKATTKPTEAEREKRQAMAQEGILSMRQALGTSKSTSATSDI